VGRTRVVARLSCNVVAEVLAAVEALGVRAWKAEACFSQTLVVARHQQPKAWELRAAMSLVRVWQQQGKRLEVRQLLGPIYGWFTKCFDIADLKAAKALLQELS
jgi:predicted ATPase